ncbi:hypothetical protein LZC95_49435 [Pendulispora brunnea]|uniref:Uncharacterized protein n=1 Tax=Pendulispora brunnea TaxID=2905690 RepID=A0ABZ2K8P9_9BACT
MNSIRFASMVAAFAVGLVGYASEALAEQPVGQVDPSSIYQPTPNSRPLAVQPPVTVTGVVGSPARVAPAPAAQMAKAPKVSTTTITSATFYNPSPNERTAAVTAPAASASTSASTAYNPSPNYKPVFVAPTVTAANVGKAPAAAPSQTLSSLYNPSPNAVAAPAAETRVATQKAQQRTAALRVSASEGLPGISPNLR